jgi:methyl-accepting chemotaxis protein
VEEQAATVQSMSRTIGQAADGTTAITVSINDMDTMTVQASTGAGETAAAARELDQLAERLRVLVGDFRC